MITLMLYTASILALFSTSNLPNYASIIALLPTFSLFQHAPSDSNSSDLITLDGLPVVKAIALHRDRKKGFGFTIERGEVTRGSAAVLVASITRKGPADLDGKLQVGDQILDIDGQKILGYAYEKVGN